MGIFESSLPIQFFMMLHRLRGWLGLSGTRVLRLRATVGVADEDAATAVADPGVDEAPGLEVGDDDAMGLELPLAPSSTPARSELFLLVIFLLDSCNQRLRMLSYTSWGWSRAARCCTHLCSFVRSTANDQDFGFCRVVKVTARARGLVVAIVGCRVCSLQSKNCRQ